MAKPKNKKSPGPANLSVLATLCPDIDALLNKCGNGSSLEKLTGKEYEELWSNLFLALLNHLSSSEEESQLFTSQTVLLIEKACAYDIVKASKSQTILKILSALNEESMQSTSNEELKSRICKLDELWLANKDLPVVKRMDVFTLRHLLSLVISVPNPSVADMKRLCGFGTHATAVALEGHIPLINKLIAHPIFVASEWGQKFLGRIASLSEAIFVSVFQSINLELDECKGEIAVAYGRILTNAWYNADNELKATIQFRFQSLMEEFIRMKRTALEMSKRGKNAMKTIDVWNVEVRKKAKDDFTKMITDCYQPILWKYFQIGEPGERCNAANLFLKAFPLQIPGDADASNELFDKQIEQMTQALRDDCWIVRVIAIREILNILPVYWSEFTSAQIQKLMTIIMNEDAADTSTPDVRRTVWRGLTNFVKHKQGLLYLKTIIPMKGDYIRDYNAGVRKAFIQLLIAIREEENVPLSTLIDVSSCFVSLMHENQGVGWLIVKLLMPDICDDEMPAETCFMNLCKLIYRYPHAYRNMFMYSKNVLPFEQAEVIMAEILHRLGKHVMIKAVPLNNDDEDDRENRSPNSTDDQSSSLSERNNSTVSSQKSGNHILDNSKIVIGLFDIVTILWSLHSVKIDEKAREELKRRKLTQRQRKSDEGIEPTLHDIYVSYVPRFVSYYKGSEIFNSVVSLCGNIPTRMLTSNSITLPGACMKKLKTMKANRDEDHVALVALVKWGMGDQIIDQITMWLEATLAAADDSGITTTSKRVKISEADEPNSLMVPYILDTLFAAEHTKTPMLMKHYDKILELWKMMAAVTRLLHRRILRKTPFSHSQLSDEFLTTCFRRYMQLIPLLHKPASDPNHEPDDSTPQETPQPFDAKAELRSMIQWTQEDTVPYLDGEPADCPDLLLVANIINDVLYVSDNMVAIHLADPSFYPKLFDFSLHLLNCEYNLHFVKGVSRLTTAINYATHQIRRTRQPISPQIWTNMVPTLIFQTFNALVSRARPKDEFLPSLQDFDEVKKNTGKILSSYQYHFEHLKHTTRSDLAPLELMASKALNALRVELSREVPREDKTVPFYSSLASLPTAACVVITPFYKSDFWTSYFFVILKRHLGRTVKILLIDIIIIHLFGTKSAKKRAPIFKEVVHAAVEQLKKFKSPRESGGGAHSLGLTLTHVEAEKEVDGEDEEEAEAQLPHVREAGSEGSATRDSAPSNMATVGTLAVDGSRPSEVTEATMGSRAPSSQPTAMDSENAGSGSRDSAPSNMATVGTLTVDGSRPSEVTEATMGIRAPSSQPTAMDSEIAGSQPCRSDFESQMLGTQQVFSQMTVGSSQPVCSQQATVGSSQPQSSQPDEDEARVCPEDDLLEDFILVGEELLRNIIKNTLK